jgi:Ca2+-binding RTX toxin-like protein
MRAKLQTLVAVVVLLTMIAVPARATHEPVQTLPVDGQSSEVYVGLADDGTATAVWDDNGAVKTATRPTDGFFGVPQTLETGGASDVVIDESPNGNAVAAWSGGMTNGNLLVSVRLGAGSFAPPQVLIGPGGNSAFDVDVAISNEGYATVVWQETPVGEVPAIKASLSDGQGAFTTNVTLQQAVGMQNPKVDMDDLGNALAVWDLTSDIENAIRMATAPAAGSWGPATTLEVLEEQGPGEPDVAVNAAGDAVVVWEGYFPDDQCDRKFCPPLPELEVAYGNVAGTFGFTQALTDPYMPHSTGEQEAAIDDSGTAAVLFTATINNTAGLYGAISDAAGNFNSGLVIVSPSTGGLTARSFEIAAGGGEFSAFWPNDHDQDGLRDEAWQSNTIGGSFGPAHQISPEDDSSALMAHGDRNNSSQTIGAWLLFIDGQVPQVTPVGEGTPPEYGSDSDDVLAGTDGDDVVHLLGGDDTYSGGGGNDSIYGEDGNDNLKGDAGADLVDGGAGADTVGGGGGSDTVIGGPGADKAKGGNGADTLKGGGGNDVLDGGGANALRASGASAGDLGDVINGGSGKDTCFRYSKLDVLKSCEIVKKKRAH